jgi:hypothetical protein
MVLQGTVLVHGQEHILYDAERRHDHFFYAVNNVCMFAIDFICLTAMTRGRGWWRSAVKIPVTFSRSLSLENLAKPKPLTPY